MAMSSDTLVYIVNHLFLPPRLPQSDDHAIERDLSICDVVINSAQAFEAISATSPVHPPWTPIIKMLTGLRALHMTPSLDKREVQKLMIEVQSGDNLIIPVMTQNACVIVRRLEGSTVYESFEIDPPNAEVMGTKGRLIRSFPGPAYEVADTESTTLFQAEFASFLANMDVGDVDSTPISVKAKSEVKEIRDTSDPHYITRLLTAIIHGLPDSQSINIERVEKHVRNEIMWNKAYKPWRRSPLWLIMRVAIQTTLVRLGGSHGQLCYKAFMISLFADILLVGDCRHLSTDLLVCLGDKLARRLRKLSEVAPELISKATSAIEKTNAILRERWDQIRRGSDEVHKPLWAPQALNISADTHLSLLSSKDYLSQRLQQSITPLVEPEFRPSEFPRITDDVFHTLDTKEISAALAADPYVALADIEQFAQERLDSWVQTYCFSVSACVALGKCLPLYAETAKTKYAGNPEDQSLMLLTIFQLWSALDQLAISQLPILAEYSPEIPESLLEPLLLRKAESIQGLVRFHEYLKKRHNRACQGSIFTDELTHQSFAIRHFDNSDELALLKQEIEATGHAARDAKLKELDSATAKYKSLKQEAGLMDHYYYYYQHRRYSCVKCAREEEADDMRISVHEWPLPRDTLSAKAVVFELRCPDAFRTWRMATYTILFDVCRPGLPILETEPRVETTLQDYAGLQQFCRNDLSGVTYASITKSFMKSHYSTPHVADANASSVLVHNALEYRLFDESRGRWVAGSFSDCTVKPLCTFKLPSASPYFALQYAVDGTTHSANQPIAEQAEVPPELDLQEHVAFGTLRSGAKIQWLNIVREMRARTLSFHQHDVQSLLIQAALQVGPINGHDLEWHEVLRNPTFGVTLLCEVDDFLSSIEGNWRNIAALQTFVILIGRLLAVNEEEIVVDLACSVLRKARNIAYKWTLSLLDDLKKATDDTNSNMIRLRICAAAATCRASFDMDSRFLDRLFSGNGDVEVFIQCSVHVLDCTPPGHLPYNLEYLLARDRRLSQSLAPFLWEKIRVDNTSINNSVLAVWSSFTPGSKLWKRLSQPNDRWLMSLTTRTLTDAEAIVHLNLFDGSLLINGKPVGRLPSAITSHPTYVRLLGQKTFDVIPSVLPNMDFATCNLVFGDLSLHFKLTEPDRKLIIQAKCGVDLYELIPHTAFNNVPSGPDLPFAFLESYAHWLQLYPTSDKSSGRIEFHPLQSAWRSSPKSSQDNWCLHFTPSGSKMQHGHSLLMVDIRSPTCEMVSRRLQPLEVREYVHVVLNIETSRLSADLPRYKLSFFLNDGQELESKTIRDMVVDSDQSTGTMFGLADQLVLKAVDPRFTKLALPGSRSVIIPFGDVSSRTGQLHTITRIPLDNHIGPVKYFKYDVDLILGRLVGTTLLSDLYKVYLHACTSFPLPDPLTNRTGTEEALKELESANCLSFQKLSSEELEVLHKISDLSPILEWYPKHLRVMQTIHWHKIGPLAQHWAFNARVQAILQFHQTLNSLEMEDTQKNLPNPRESHLLTRFSSRTFRLYCAVEDIPLFPSDERYPSSGHLTDSRSSVDNKNGFKIASDVSALVQKMPSRLKTVPDLWTWLNTSDLGTFENDDRTISLSYQSDFLHPSLSRLFVPVYNRCREGQALQTMTELTFTLPAIAYNSPRHVDLLPTLLAFNTLSSSFRDIDPPRWESYDLSFGVTLDGKMLDAVIEKYPHPLSTNQPNRHAGETEERFLARQKASHAAQIKELVNDLVAQWPCEAPFIPNRAQFSLIEVGSKEMKAEITELFQHWFKNMHFRAYVDQVQVVLNNAHLASSSSVPSIIAPYEIQWSPSSSSGGKHRPITLDELLVQRNPPALVVPARAELPPSLYAARNFASQSPPGSTLDPLVEEFTNDPQVLHRHYGRALDSSLKSYLAQQNVKPLLHHPSISFERLHHDYESGRRDSESILDSIKTALAPVTAFEKAENLAGQWPQVTARSLLALLSEKAKSRLNEPTWIARIVLFAQSLVRLQRTQRLLRLKLAENIEGLIKELGDDQFEKDILCHPTEWLLIQIDGDFAVRPIQMRVAQEMITPSSKQNTLLQLNMGEGKSSVIVPLVSATLASGDKIIRVVVLKPLANQMFQLLVRRLSGLANRRIFYLPFSRDFKPTLPRLTLLRSVYETCMREGGVLLVQPEHILSFKLMGVDLATGACGDEVTDALLASQRWLTSMSRDVLDESDEILSVIYQLVYTSGIQEPLEDHPDRWIIIQEILGYAKKHAQRLHEENPAGLDVKETRAGEFPIIRILEPKAGEHLIRSIAKEMALSERLSRLPQAIRQAAWDFVTCNGSGLDTAESSLKSTGTWPYLLLCRGFVGHGLLRFVFQEKRWRVDYGLDPIRTLLAVPYRAKDVPSLRADFGHPDVAIALTCLSYYYGGLTEEQLEATFQLLFRLDDPESEYKAWVAFRVEVPDSLREIIGVNLEDQQQWKTMLIPLFYRNQAVINFYLSNVVFPKDAKQFPRRFATSSWDLAETKPLVTTGFSGTNDNRYLLPTSVEQRDPLNQLGTNAQVLSYLLRPENSKYMCLHHEDQPLSSWDFLDLVIKQKPSLRVLLDVGAQMLDMKSTEIASLWIELVPTIQAVVFFDEADKLVVMSRDHTIEHLVSSQFSQKLDLCAIYLDDAHTRGTDLKLPKHFRAAVTLGPRLTKDRLVQGCMRMRLLGVGQSVMFFAPPEVDRVIRERGHIPPAEKVEVVDILRWVMQETCRYIQHHLSHWAQQGVEYKRRKDAWDLYESQDSTQVSRERLRSSWEEPDARSLEELYAPPPHHQSSAVHPAFQIPDLKQRLDDLGVSSLENPEMDEEHEREVSHEAERERQIDRPERAEAAPSSIQPNLRRLIVDGTFNGSTFVPLFYPPDDLGKLRWSTELLSTMNFATTIKGGKSTGYYLRPVNWILSGTKARVLVALSPYEVNELLPEIQKSKHVHLHIYSPRVNQARRSFEDLTFFSIPALPPTWSPFPQNQISQLNLWAGQLYLKDHGTYKNLCLILGIVSYDSTGENGHWKTGGFIEPTDRRGLMAEECKLEISPLPFLKELISSRRKGMNYSSTHMGKIVDGRRLTQETDFEA
ncbi:hypothetical protein FPV67DRAFT_1608613 [Lyophyllum atratum]|nr:hypothetical protein FPV67DRAFT_1608613 [Lyophyllum atratum]